MTEDRFRQSLQSLRQISAAEPIDLDVSSQVVQKLRSLETAPVAARFLLPAGAVLACVVALVCGVVALISISSVTDPMSAMVSPFQVQMQW